jgi:hypothetical protein
MINIYQVNLSREDVDTINSGSELPIFNATRSLMFGEFDNKFLEFFQKAYEVSTDCLDEAFEVTNLWNKQELVDVIGDECTSSSVGNLFEKNGVFYLCKDVCFEMMENITCRHETLAIL